MPVMGCPAPQPPQLHQLTPAPGSSSGHQIYRQNIMCPPSLPPLTAQQAAAAGELSGFFGEHQEQVSYNETTQLTFQQL